MLVSIIMKRSYTMRSRAEAAEATRLLTLIAG